MKQFGLHGGKLMVAEVGFVKKELAYHGDVINTAARIQAECNAHNVNLLLSESLLLIPKGLTPQLRFILTPVDNIQKSEC